MVLKMFLYGRLMFMEVVHFPQDKASLFGKVKFPIQSPVNWY